MISNTSSDSILVNFPPSLNEDQVQAFPNYTNISEGNLLTGTKISMAYNVPPGNGAGVKVGIISLGGGFSQADLNRSMTNLGLTTGNVTFVGIDGATNTPVTGSVADQENALDLVCVAGMVPSANIVLYKGLNSGVYFNPNANSANTLNSNSSFGNAIQRAVDDNCNVITISWGINEQQTIGNVISYCGDYLAAPLANAAARNISVFVSSGDYGSAATSNATIGMSVDYPSSNPNVTAVGGTYLTLTNNNTRNSETVYNNSEAGLPSGFGGSGGVSSINNSLPSYQTSLTYKTYPGNTVSTLTTRGVPDISAAMNAYGYWLNGTVRGGSGTSASAPIMAGMMARFISLNGGRKPPGGSSGLNKIFYQNYGSFNDIMTGNNASLLPTGYSATPLWDAVTGLGSQANATQTYQSVTSAGVRVRTSSGWAPVQSIKVKTAANTWTAVNKVWTKTSTGWQQVY
jgi:kumamolisin